MTTSPTQGVSTQAMSTQGISILLVDDHPVVRQGYRRVLEHQDDFHVVAEADNAAEAYRAFKAHAPDVVVMDISMPGMDGLTAARKIREESGSSQPPIIAITAYGEAAQKKALEAGCDASLSKPIDFDDLEPVLSRYLSK